MLLINLCVLAACAPGNTVNYGKQIRSWIGADTDALVRVWGPPDRSYTFRDGSSVLEFVQTRAVDDGWASSPTVGYSHGSHGRGALVLGTRVGFGTRQVALQTCRTTFEANKKGVVTNAFYEGSSCRVPQTALRH